MATLRLGDIPGFHARVQRGTDRISQVDRQQLGRPVLPPEGFYPSVHHRTRLHGQAEGGVRGYKALRPYLRMTPQPNR
jgi:hypothetical protein